MMITVEDNPLALLELLWVREAWGLTTPADSPPPLEQPAAKLGAANVDAEWERAWPQLWQECLDHLAIETGPLLQQLPNTADGSPERARALGLVLGPSWHDRFADDSLGTPFLTWQTEQRSAQPNTHDVPLDVTPERRSVRALVSAWEAGLTKVVTLPCRGEYTRAVSGSTLILTNNDHRDQSRYGAALREFTSGSLK
ncbi:hypothetical protein [Rathayibacter festucae]|uniref:hypothetical protein n=1 Tax=Rathayibacter festucae TaxID=110937 RepID=UPI002A6B7710|nr:hypothetical protein [Rathayibacter festucae]MDY0912301.1 hypothetical protein [Rathayibacter festucae]